MSAGGRGKKPLKSKRTQITVESFSPGCFMEFVDSSNRASALPRTKSLKPAKAPVNGTSSKKAQSVQDRRYLKDIEIWLNNCVNFAQRLEAKQGAKILELLTEARERTIRLRG